MQIPQNDLQTVPTTKCYIYASDRWWGAVVVVIVVVSYLVKVHSKSELLLSWAFKTRKKMKNTTTIDQLVS